MSDEDVEPAENDSELSYDSESRTQIPSTFPREGPGQPQDVGTWTGEEVGGKIPDERQEKHSQKKNCISDNRN